jgi:hypothetical protein
MTAIGRTGPGRILAEQMRNPVGIESVPGRPTPLRDQYLFARPRPTWPPRTFAPSTLVVTHRVENETPGHATAAPDRPTQQCPPHWVYPGDHKIQRHVLPYALSSDNARLTRLKNDVAMYRLAFGQPRQEDLIAILESKGIAANSDALAEYRIELRPPGRGLQPDA